MNHFQHPLFVLALGALSCAAPLQAQSTPTAYYGEGNLANNQARLTDEAGHTQAFWDGTLLWWGEQAYRIEQKEEVLALVGVVDGDTLGRWTHWSKYCELAPGMEYFRLKAEGNPREQRAMSFKRSWSEGGNVDMLYRVENEQMFYEIHGARSKNEALFFFAVLIDQHRQSTGDRT